jgi:hypothetical protein
MGVVNNLNQVELRKATVGHDFGDPIEIVSGDPRASGICSQMESMKAKAKLQSKKKTKVIETTARSPQVRFAPGEPTFLTSRSITDLGLVYYAQAAAQQLLAGFPSVIFTSGRRDAKQQADAMAGNVLQNRKWIEQTYLPSPEREQLQCWVDSHTAAVTQAAIAAGLAGIMAKWTDAQKKNLSPHFSGQAFDVHPVAGDQGTALKNAIPNLPNLRTFLEKEGGLVIWHADFERT